jgi:hypothetical protein
VARHNVLRTEDTIIRKPTIKMGAREATSKSILNMVIDKKSDAEPSQTPWDAKSARASNKV